MGIRMHMTLGYGLDLSAWPSLDRSRLNWDILEDGDLYAEWSSETLAFADREKETMERVVFHSSMKPPTILADLIVYSEEFGDPDRLVLLPALSRKEFIRYGDLIDIYLLEAQKGPSASDDLPTEWLPFKGTLYPYVGLMKPNPNKPLGIEKYWEPCYLDKEEHKDAIAWAPWHLWFLLRTVFTLTNAETTEIFLSLRPGIYRHWG